MLTTSQVIKYLKTQFVGTKFYNETINRDDPKCIGIYMKDRIPSNLAIGGLNNTSYSVLPISILIHWGEDSKLCDDKAISIYNALFGKSQLTMDSISVIFIDVPDATPIFVGRDDKGICESTIRANIYYKREVN